MSEIREHMGWAEYYAGPIDVEKYPSLGVDYMQAKALSSIANSLVVIVKLAAAYLEYDVAKKDVDDTHVPTKPSS